MIISPDILRKELLSLLTQIDLQIARLDEEAKMINLLPEQLRDYNGDWVMIPLWSAKSNVLSALVQLNQQRTHTPTTRKKSKESNG